jgi:hypothetical protein
VSAGHAAFACASVANCPAADGEPVEGALSGGGAGVSAGAVVVRRGGAGAGAGLVGSEGDGGAAAVGRGAAGAGAGTGLVGAEGEGAAVVVTAPVRHCATYAFSVMPLAWKLALSALQSSMQAFAVFCWLTLGALVVGAGAGLGAEGAAVIGAAPARHCATYAFSVTPLAWKLVLSALHSSMQAFAVFC